MVKKCDRFWGGHTPDFKVYVGFEGLVSLDGKMSKFKALLQKSLCRRNETRHRHGDPQEIHTLLPVVTIHVLKEKTRKESLCDFIASNTEETVGFLLKEKN